MELNLKNTILITLIGIYASWGFIFVLYIGSFLEAFYHKKQIGDEIVFYILIMVLIYVAIGCVIGWKFFVNK